MWWLLVCAGCSKGHPKWELPTEQVGEGESKEADVDPLPQLQ